MPVGPHPYVSGTPTFGEPPMTVTHHELRSWTAPGAQDAAQRTYASVRDALSDFGELDGLDYDVFLQGSYANHTNTRGDSDVDIVVMLKTTFMPETRLLPAADLARYEASRMPARVHADEFRSRVHRALVARYGATAVQSKDKCLKIPKQGNRVDADVVPCLQDRRYTAYPAHGHPSFVEGISIKPLSGGRIVNYPKEHISNGEAKNKDTAQAYKPTVRQIKRLRRFGVDKGLITRDQAPGYLLECMTFNAPASTFAGDEAVRVGAVLRWLDQHTAEELAARIRSCDKIHHLFIDDPGGHNQYTAKRTLATLLGML